MAATDQAYRNQLRLDIVFAVSSILMLFSIVWMLVDDYRREYKTEQRIFRDVEMAMAQRDALQKLPTKAAFEAAADTVAKEEEKHKLNQDQINKFNADIAAKLPEKDVLDLKLSDLKARFDSKKSFYDIAVDNSGPGSDHTKALKSEIEELAAEIGVARNNVEGVTQQIKGWQSERDKLDKPLTAAIGSLKKLLDGFDRQLNLSIKKQWTIYDDIRAIPVLDGFAAPTKIEQITLRDLTIDYNFVGATRFDRCTTCHKGIGKPAYTKTNLEDLWYSESPRMKEKLGEANWILEHRKTLLADLDEGRSVPGEGALKLTMLSDKRLTPARISEFAAHPRLDVFVDPNSKHPVEKFGCTICHGGQPSGTSFTFAAHTPNDAATLKQWKKEHDWQAQHDWDYPMLPHRFVESSCLKCHHQVTDLYSDGNKTEAPKLLKGYDLIREFGCFGCHEINGFKGGREIGPDLRLEPNPPLEKLTPAEVAKLMSDPDNPPGAFRKVGPSLRRVSEKTNEEWARKWIMAPREFRPDTKMPHYYGLSNNDDKALAGTGQTKFPPAEVYGIVHYLFKTSREYVGNIAKAHDPNLAARIAELEGKSSTLTDAEKTELENAKVLRGSAAAPLDKKLAEIKGDVKVGRDLFSKKGCLACHSHAATNEASEDWPAIPSEADFGPNLTQVKEKLVGKDGKTDKATLWLTNWIKNPTNHSPRTRMPVTHLTDKEAADIAAWLLAQNIPVDEKSGKIAIDLQGPNWASMNVIAPEETDLRDLAKVYLDRTLAATEVEEFFKSKLDARRVKDLGVDEQELDEMLKRANGKEEDARRDALLYYVGKRAVGRLGCFGCHDIPGFDSAKPVGTALADWGKKDPGRLAFEDIANYVKKHFPKTSDSQNRVVDSLVDEDGFPRSVTNGELYETFYYNALMHESREGYLNQKLREPRSYDFNRIRPWDDRARMPQFKFGRVKMKPAEEPGEFNARKQWAEAMAMPVDGGTKARKAESVEDFKARRELAEAQNREAVMTFVLGLLADPIPLQYLNHPSTERMAEVKGRQILDKFNCAGCHVVRPGVYEFKLTEKARGDLKATYDKNMKDAIYKDDFDFTDHRAWFQPLQTRDVGLMHGVRPILSSTGKKPTVRVTLSEALQVPDGKGGKVAFRATDNVSLAPGDLIWPPISAFRSPDTFRAWERDYGTQGGAFAALLGNYLKDESYPFKKLYLEPGPAVPPLLNWQGGRTQAGWLFQFLQDPPKVRESTVLRMPKFNMSNDDARRLVEYFAAEEKRFNPDTGITEPFPKTPQRANLDTDYWQSQTAKYIGNLKKVGQYQKEVELLKPIWERMIKDWKTDLADAQERKKTADLETGKIDKEFAAAKDEKDKEALKKKKEDADSNAGRWKNEMERLDGLVKTKTPKALEEDWGHTEAYALAGYRLLVNQCNKCHTVGNLKPQQETGLGPPLNLASDRLRPEWAKTWVANPQRFIPYISAMPAYFKHSDTVPLVNWLPGKPVDQVEGARDAILNLPRIEQMPLTRYWMKSGQK